jgi:hypothetical protein
MMTAAAGDTAKTARATCALYHRHTYFKLACSAGRQLQLRRAARRCGIWSPAEWHMDRAAHLHRASTASVPAGRIRVTIRRPCGAPPGTLASKGTRTCILSLRFPARTLPPNSSTAPEASTAIACWHAATGATREAASCEGSGMCTAATCAALQVQVCTLNTQRSLRHPWPVATDIPPCMYTCRDTTAWPRLYQ